MRNFSTTFVLSLALSILLAGCESESSDLLNQAQTCLNEADETNRQEVLSCHRYIEKLDSQNANLIKCSIELVAGGLTAERMVTVYTEVENNEDPELLFIGALSFDSVERVEQAINTCQKSQIDSFVYISSLAKIGTLIEEAAGGFEDVIPSETELATVIQECTDGSSTSCDTEEIGEALLLLEKTYCDGSNSESTICKDVDQAMENAGGDVQDIAIEFFCQIDNSPPACS